jgi:hypothetical protein
LHPKKLLLLIPSWYITLGYIRLNIFNSAHIGPPFSNSNGCNATEEHITEFEPSNARVCMQNAKK